ncbi:MAG: AI-2E family transporter [Planctomycetota bacterium]
MTEVQYDPKSFPSPWNYLIPLGMKILIWALFFASIWMLRSFMPLVFLTFVFSYIAEHGVRGLEHRIHSRKIRTAIVFVTMIGVMALIGTLLGPQLKKQAVSLDQKRPVLIQQFNKTINELKEDSFLETIIGNEQPSDLILQALGVPPSVLHGGEPGVATQNNMARHADPEKVAATLGTLLKLLGDIASITTMFLLSLLFAFLIVRDLPKVSRGVESLQNTRLRVVYHEIGETVVRFGVVLGRFLEAQLVIAIINTILTSIGMFMLGIESIVFLSAFVFICSFIPVAGVFISTVPICVIALQGPTGPAMVLWVILMVSIVHIVEAYVLNPLIMGHHLRLNPVLVLAVLIIAHKLFGLWGLILGVPTVTYFLSHAIRLVKQQAEKAD